VFQRLRDITAGLTEGSAEYSEAVILEMENIADDLARGIGKLDGTGL
jgi:hypothetical protein